ncbi:MAG: hypothetical protein IJ744_09420 [Lachnospiraceae bacterium]|nr:hypothetical protein [Lachnospiraceae bacterium]
MIHKVIFVSANDASRGPMAEAIYKRMDTTGEVEVLSRGTVVLFQEPINPKVLLVLGNHETRCEKERSTPFDPKEVTEDTLVLTMDERQKNQIYDNYGISNRVYTIKEFVSERGDVIDPYGLSLMDYQDCYMELVRLIKKVIYRLTENRA